MAVESAPRFGGPYFVFPDDWQARTCRLCLRVNVGLIRRVRQGSSRRVSTDPGSESSTGGACRIARLVEFCNGAGMRCRQRSETKECMRPRPRRASAVPRARVMAALLPGSASDPILIELPEVKAAIRRTATLSQRWAPAGRRAGGPGTTVMRYVRYLYRGSGAQRMRLNERPGGEQMAPIVGMATDHAREMVVVDRLRHVARSSRLCASPAGGGVAEAPWWILQ
jgi:hypothetical protein